MTSLSLLAGRTVGINCYKLVIIIYMHFRFAMVLGIVISLWLVGASTAVEVPMSSYVVRFYMLIYLNKGKWLRICLKNAFGENSFIEKTYAVGTHWNCLIETLQCVPKADETENKEENYLEIYIFQASFPLSLPL